MTAIEEILSKYIENTDRVFAEIKLSHEAVYINRKKTSRIVNMARRYLEDAKYYQDRKKFETGLASVAYSEGLLDALRLLDIAQFQWPIRKGEG